MKKPKTATAAQKRFIEEKNQRDEKKSVYLLSAIMGTTALVMFIINILNEYYLISLLSFSYVIISIFSLVIFKKTHNYKVWTHLFLAFAFITAIFLFYSGGTKGAGVLWAFVFPMLAFHFKKIKVALPYSLALFLALLALFLFDIRVTHNNDHSHSPVFMFVYFLILLSLIFFEYASGKQKSQNEKVLQESKDRFYSLFDQLSIGVALVNTDMQLLEANQQLRKWFPQIQDPNKSTCFASLGSEDNGTLCAECQAGLTMKDGLVHTVEVEKIIGGKKSTARVTAHPFFDAEGKITSVIETIEDVSDHVLTKQALHTADQFYNQALDMFCIIGFDGHFKALNPAWEKDLEWTSIALTGQPFASIVYADDQKMTTDFLTQISKSDSALTCEFRVVSKSGSMKWVSMKCIPDQKDSSIFAVTRDITIEKKNSAKRLESEQKLNSLIANLPGFVYHCSVDDNWDIFFMSEGCHLLTGHPPQDFLNSTISFGEIIHPDDREKVWKQWQSSIADQKPFECDYRIIHADGSLRWMWEKGHVKYDKENQRKYLDSFITDITASKNAQKAQRESEEKFKTLMNTAAAGIYMYRNDHFILVNPAVEAITGYTKHELANKTLQQLIHPDSLEKVTTISAERFKGKKPIKRYDIKMIKADGSAIWIDHSAELVMVEDQPTVIGTFFDITQQKNITEALKISEERERLINSNIYDVIWVVNTKTMSFTYISPSVYHLRGYTAEEAMEQSLEESLTPESAKIIEANSTEAYNNFIVDHDRNRSHRVVTIQQPCKDGSLVHVEVSTHLQLNQNGEVEIVGVSRNVNERKKMEDAIQLNAAFQETIADISKKLINFDKTENDEVLFHALEQCGNFLKADRCTIFKLSDDANTLTATHEWFRENIESFGESNSVISLDKFHSLKKIIQSQAHFYVEDIQRISENSRNEREMFAMRKTKTLLVIPLMKTDKVFGYFCFESVTKSVAINDTLLGYLQVLANIFADAIMKIELDSLLRQNTLQLAESNDTKNRLFSIIAHDLRSPFTSFIGLSELMAEEGIIDSMDDMRKHAMQLHTLALSTYDLLDNLLQWSRLQSGSLQPNIQNQNVSRFFESVISSLIPLFEQKFLKFNNLTNNELTGFFDSKMLEIVIRNLLSNAAKFTHPGGKIIISGRKDHHNQLILTVEDTGIGIPQQTLAELFTFSNTKGRIGLHGERSSGLGLMLCKEFVEKHNGSITVDSVENKGSTFTIVLPQNEIGSQTRH